MTGPVIWVDIIDKGGVFKVFLAIAEYLSKRAIDKLDVTTLIKRKEEVIETVHKGSKP